MEIIYKFYNKLLKILKKILIKIYDFYYETIK